MEDVKPTTIIGGILTLVGWILLAFNLNDIAIIVFVVSLIFFLYNMITD